MHSMMNRSVGAGPLALVLDLINTKDLESGDDALGTPEKLRTWLRDAGLLAPGDTVSAAAHSRFIRFREALRSLALANNGEPAAPETLAALNVIARGVRVAPRFTDDARLELGSAGRGADGALAAVLVRVYSATEQGGWPRLKACQNPACHWAFFDQSKNRSRRWCAMVGCGNRMKARAYVARRRSARQTP